MVWQQCQVLCPISVWDERSSAGCGGANAVISPLLAGLAAGKPIASQAGCPAWDDGAGCAGSHSRSADEAAGSKHSAAELGLRELGAAGPERAAPPQWAAAAILRVG